MTNKTNRGPSFDVHGEEIGLIHDIAARAVKMYAKITEGTTAAPYPLLDADMDITACHASGCPLRLDELLMARDADFAHDVFGIRRHLDRATGKLGDCFLPRYARP